MDNKKKPFFFIKTFSAAAIFFSFLYVTAVMVDPDLGWHLRVGEWILENHAIQRVEMWSYTIPGAPWVDHEWLQNIAFFLAYSRNLWWLAVLVFALLASAPFLLSVRRARTLPHLWIVILTALLTMNFIGVRPQIVSFFFFFLLLEIFERHRERGERRYSWALPLFFFLWANLHAGVFAGIVLFGLFVFADYLKEWMVYKKASSPRARRGLIVFFISFLAVFINAFGWRLYLEIFRAMQSPYLSRYIMEWRPALSFPSESIGIFLGIFLFLFFKFWRRYPLPLLVVNAVFGLSFLKTIRMGPLFFLVSLPLLERGIGCFREEITLAFKKKPPSPKTLRLLAATGGILFLALFLYFGSAVYGYRGFSSPEKAVNFLLTEGKEREGGNILNTYGWGGYLVWKASEVKIFIDGRMADLIGPDGSSAMEEYVRIFYSGDDNARREIFSRRNIRTVLIENTPPATGGGWWGDFAGEEFKRTLRESRVGKFLERLLGEQKVDLKAVLQREGWKVAYEDETAVILTCPSSPSRAAGRETPCESP